MEYTFYQKVKNDPDQITWKDIFSEYKKKHSKAELEYAMLAGTSMNMATEADMLQKWQKPWIWYPMAKGGLFLFVLFYGIFFGTTLLNGGIMTNSFVNMLTIIPPLVAPIVLMIFLWELNVPRNISIYELLAYFLVGGFVSFAANSFMFQLVPDEQAYMAAFREEPAKLIASLIFMVIFSRKKKMYGLTGLVIGAAIGTGFGAFESISYAFNFGTYGIGTLIQTQITRAVFAIGGHTVYCAPYMAALALAAKNSKITWECFLDKDFLLTFVGSVAAHFVWNSGLLSQLGIIKNILIIVFLWIELLYILKKCMRQIVEIGIQNGSPWSTVRHESGSQHRGRALPAGTASALMTLTLMAGSQGASSFRVSGSSTVYIGRGEGNQLHIPAQETSVSRRHCSVQYTEKGWTVRDLNSSCGTYLSNGQRLTPGTDYLLRNGETIYLGGKRCMVQVRF